MAIIVVWMILGKIILRFYRKHYCDRYPILKELQQREDEEVLEFQNSLKKTKTGFILVVITNSLLHIIVGLLWPYDMYVYHKWLQMRLRFGSF